jgi:hypothetical protein
VCDRIGATGQPDVTQARAAIEVPDTKIRRQTGELYYLRGSDIAPDQIASAQRQCKSINGDSPSFDI